MQETSLLFALLAMGHYYITVTSSLCHPLLLSASFLFFFLSSYSPCLLVLDSMLVKRRAIGNNLKRWSFVHTLTLVVVAALSIPITLTLSLFYVSLSFSLSLSLALRYLDQEFKKKYPDNSPKNFSNLQTKWVDVSRLLLLLLLL